jgi:hypothetical protein
LVYCGKKNLAALFETKDGKENKTGLPDGTYMYAFPCQNAEFDLFLKALSRVDNFGVYF